MKQSKFVNSFEGGYKQYGHPFKFNSTSDPDLGDWRSLKPGQWLHTKDGAKGRYLGVLDSNGRVLVCWKHSFEGFEEYNNRFTREYKYVKSLNLPLHSRMWVRFTSVKPEELV